MTFDRHKVVMDITFAAWCEVNIEFAELLFFVKLWRLGFGFDMSERMSEEMSESMSKDMSERCQKICQKECHLKDLNSLNLVLGTKLVQNSDLVFSPRSKFSLKGLNLQD